MIERVESVFRGIRRWISRTEISLRLLRLPSEKGAAAEPGLLMIQIDGLPRAQFEKALASGLMPFMRDLLKKEHYRTRTFYSGLPSSTPGVQGELFYGERCAVPAFSFFDRENGQILRMYTQDAVLKVEGELREKGGTPLLAGGSSYSNTYRGGASESHFCAANLGWNTKLPSLWRVMAVFVMNAYSIIRMIALMFVEFGLAIVDFFRGLIEGQDFFKELKFIPTRVGICVGLRELLVAGASMDLARGLPIVHLNFLGYDEQAHRRGPTSAFAHWTLIGIDDAIKRLYSEAMRSRNRDYAVWIYSDHGQEETTPFYAENDKTIHEAVREIFDRAASHISEAELRERQNLDAERAGWPGLLNLRRWKRRRHAQVSAQADAKVVVTAMGPVGHVYCHEKMDESACFAAARKLVEEAGAPAVAFRSGENKAVVCTADGDVRLPEQWAYFLGLDHSIGEEAARDLVRLVHSPLAGDFVLLGWRRNGKPVSFPIENGAHAGPGPEECRGFLMLPPGTLIHSAGGKPYYRPSDLRAAALHYLKREVYPPEVQFPSVRGSAKLIRVMTYNVRRCRGLDGKLSPERIARVISQQQPDIVALQELDVGHARSNFIDQARAIADILMMKFHFFPEFENEDEKHGLAILSHYPTRLINSGNLPVLKARRRPAPRGAQWASVEFGGGEIQVLNTRLSLNERERRMQVKAILSEEWLGSLGDETPLIVCGDMNAQPNSFVHRRICARFFDVQRIMANHRPLRTFHGRYPAKRIDHIFVSSHFEAERVAVPRTTITCVASNHLPLVAEMRLKK